MTFLESKVVVESQGNNPSYTLARHAPVYKAHSHKLPTVHRHPGFNSSLIAHRAGSDKSPLTSHKFPSSIPYLSREHVSIRNCISDTRGCWPCVSFPSFHTELTGVLRLVKLHEHERYFIRHFISAEDEALLY